MLLYDSPLLTKIYFPTDSLSVYSRFYLAISVSLLTVYNYYDDLCN